MKHTKETHRNSGIIRIIGLQKCGPFLFKPLKYTNMELNFFEIVSKRTTSDEGLAAINASREFMQKHGGIEYSNSGLAFTVKYKNKECLMNLTGLQMPFKKYFTLRPMFSTDDIGYGCGSEVRFDYNAKTGAMESSELPYSDMYKD